VDDGQKLGRVEAEDVVLPVKEALDSGVFVGVREGVEDTEPDRDIEGEGVDEVEREPDRDVTGVEVGEVEREPDRELEGLWEKLREKDVEPLRLLLTERERVTVDERLTEGLRETLLHCELVTVLVSHREGRERDADTVLDTLRVRVTVKETLRDTVTLLDLVKVTVPLLDLVRLTDEVPVRLKVRVAIFVGADLDLVKDTVLDTDFVLDPEAVLESERTDDGVGRASVPGNEIVMQYKDLSTKRGALKYL